LRGKDHIVDLGVDETIILKWIFKKSVRGVEWIDLALDRDGWRALLNEVTNISLP